MHANCVTAEDNMNVQLKDITVTARDGRVSHLEQVYIRGSHVRYFIVPDMLRYGSLQYEAEGRMLTISTGTRPCSDHEAREDAVLVWRVVGPRSTERGEYVVDVEGGARLRNRICSHGMNRMNDPRRNRKALSASIFELHKGNRCSKRCRLNMVRNKINGNWVLCSPFSDNGVSRGSRKEF